MLVNPQRRVFKSQAVLVVNTCCVRQVFNLSTAGKCEHSGFILSNPVRTCAHVGGNSCKSIRVPRCESRGRIHYLPGTIRHGLHFVRIEKTPCVPSCPGRSFLSPIECPEQHGNSTKFIFVACPPVNSISDDEGVGLHSHFDHAIRSSSPYSSRTAPRVNKALCSWVDIYVAQAVDAQNESAPSNPGDFSDLTVSESAAVPHVYWPAQAKHIEFVRTE